MTEVLFLTQSFKAIPIKSHKLNYIPVPTFYTLETDAALKELESTVDGLSEDKAKSNLEKYGFNEVSEKPGTPNWLVFLRQFNNPLVYILIIIAVFSLFLGKYIDSGVIFGVLLINAILGFVQEYRAEKSVQALKNLVVQTAKIVRDGQVRVEQSRNIVPGDILYLEEGDKIVADGRIIQLKNFSTVESALTGEAYSIVKKLNKLEENTSLGDRFNMVFSGSYCATGNAKVLVTATGNNTEMGKIASDLNSIETEESHFHKKVAKLGKQISIVALLGAGLNFALGLILGAEFQDNLFFAIGSLVSGIPEGLPAVLALILAVGAKQMANKNAIVRVLSATETAGAITIIASDKTGTLTQNTMTVQSVFLSNNDQYNVTGKGWSWEGKIVSETQDTDSKGFVNSKEEKNSDNLYQGDLLKVLEISTICQQANVSYKNDEYSIVGDPTEAGLFVLGKKAGYTKKNLEDKIEILDDLPFNSDLKMRATLVLNKLDKQKEIFIIGAGEEVLKQSSKITSNGLLIDLDPSVRHNIENKIADQSNQGWRVLGVAIKKEVATINDVQPEHLHELVFLGCLVLADPIRPEVPDAVLKAKQAGIRTIMITGDHKNTAISIARQIGIIDNLESDYPLALSESDLAKMSEVEFENAVLHTNVYARCTPNRKLKILEALQKNGEIVAMTGDGVNDAPALKKSNVGFAMGKIGTDVARESAQIVISDDNFATIVKAVEEGRIIYNNVTRSSNLALNRTIAGIGTLMGAILIGSGLPFNSTQLLWLNLVTETLMGVGMAFEKAHGYEMLEKPKNLKQEILNSQTIPLIIVNAVVMIILTLSAYKFYLINDPLKSSTGAFLMLYFTQFFNLLALRSFTNSIFSIGFFTNNVINLGLLVSVILQLSAISLPFLASILNFVPMNLAEISIILIASSAVLWITELSKLISKKSSFFNRLENLVD